MKTKTFEYERNSGGTLAEYYEAGKWWLEYTERGERAVSFEYSIDDPEKSSNELYLGHSEEEVQASGRDILGEKLMARGEVSYDDVIGVIGEVKKNAYCFIGGPASHSNYTVDRWGAVYRQLSGRDIGGEEGPIYEPWRDIPEIKDISARQVMLGEEYPILLNVYSTGSKIYELIYFVEPGDSLREPMLWIRKKTYDVSSPERAEYSYKAVEFIYELNIEAKDKADERTVIEALCDTVAYWVKYSRAGISLSLPEKRLERVTRGAIAAAKVTCTADKPHYGHRYYGKEIHDNFPPNYIWLIEAYCILGRAKEAKRIFEHMINYALTDEGRIAYRQGRAQIHGASACEYGCLLFLADRYFDKLEIGNLTDEQSDKLVGMGNIILDHCVPCPELEGRVLVKMCAEADTNCRVYVYLNNNLWAIRGLRALSSLSSRLNKQNGDKYKVMADILWQNVSQLLKEKAVYDERFGYLPPFRFDYSPTPSTLSYCRDTFHPMTDEEYREYMKRSVSRSIPKANVQDNTENYYANYRYYPEMLSAMLLPRELSDGAERLRENLGGEILGMTRFRSWIDNWPILHHARFLIESGRIDKYLLLLYAHTELHGHRERLCYYEQVKLDQSYNMPDCLPSLLTTPTMVGWAFAYERLSDGVLALLSAIPKSWFNEGFSISRVGYSGGEIDIKYEDGAVSLSFSSPTKIQCELIWREKEALTECDILSGKEYIKEIIGNRMILKTGLSKVLISLNR